VHRSQTIVQILDEPIEQETGVSCLPRSGEAAAGEVGIEEGGRGFHRAADGARWAVLPAPQRRNAQDRARSREPL
jgi:hypothetical protein